MNFDKPFWSTVLRESDGSASASRLLSALILVTALSWVSFLLVVSKKLPDLPPVQSFISTTTLSLYGVNKAAAVATAVFGKDNKDTSA